MADFCAPRIKAARALLNWSQEDLAHHTKLSVTTIRMLELGHRPRHETLQRVYRSIDDAGVEISEDGVRRRREAIKVFRGARSCDDFFAHLGNIASAHQGDVVAYIGSEQFLLPPSGAHYKSNLHRLEVLADALNVKCLLSDAINLPSAPSFQHQFVPRWTVRPGVLIVYGNRYSTMWVTECMEFCIVEFAVPLHALALREDFVALWENTAAMKSQSQFLRPAQRKRG